MLPTNACLTENTGIIELIEVFCGIHQFDSPSSGLPEGRMIVTTGLLAHEPLVIFLHHLRTACGGKARDFLEDGPLLVLSSAYRGKTARVREWLPFSTYSCRGFSSQGADKSCE